MKKYYLLSAFGKDRPGIVAAVTEVVFNLGGNLEDASMTRLGGEFAMMVVAELPSSVSLPAIDRALLPYKKKLDLGISVKAITPVLARSSKRIPAQYLISVYGKDRRGLVYKISSTLARRKVSITDLNTKAVAQGKGSLYIMVLEVSVPQTVDLDGLREDLDRLRTELEVEISLEDIQSVPL